MSGSISRTNTFTDGSTAFGSQVETEFENIVTDINNLDAGTSTWTNVNATTSVLTTATVTTANVTTLNNTLLHYRRPVLVYNSGTVVNVETGLDGTSGDVLIAFPDGTVRTDSDTTRVQCNIAQNAVFNNATRLSNVSGLRTGSAVANTWYACYAVKVTAGSGTTTDFVIVADTVLPIQANYASLNTNFGTSGWVYLGLIRYGDQSGATTAIIKFSQAGNLTLFRNSCTAVSSGNNGSGFSLQNVTGSTTVAYTFATGTAGKVIPNNASVVYYAGNINTGSAGTVDFKNSQVILAQAHASTQAMFLVPVPAGENIALDGPTNSNFNLYCAGFVDGVLGVGSNPLL